MRLRKLFLTILFALIFVIQGGFLGLSLGKLDGPQSIIVYSFHLSFALYLLLLSLRSVRQEYSRHAMSIVYLSVLSTVAVFLLGIMEILPSTVTPIIMARLTADTIPLPRELRYAVVLLYSVAWAVAVATPRGPAYHYPSDRIYSTQTLMAVHSKRKESRGDGENRVQRAQENGWHVNVPGACADSYSSDCTYILYSVHCRSCLNVPKYTSRRPDSVARTADITPNPMFHFFLELKRLKRVLILTPFVRLLPSFPNPSSSSSDVVCSVATCPCQLN